MDWFTLLFGQVYNLTVDLMSPVKLENIKIDKNLKEFKIGKYSFFCTPDYLLRSAVYIISFFPVRDNNERKDPIGMINEFKEKYSKHLADKELLINQGLSILNEPLTDIDYENYVKNIIKQGQGSHLITQMEKIYKVDLSEMYQFPVRDGFSKYGGVIYFDKNFNLQKAEYLDKIYYPEDYLWKNVLYVFVSSLTVCNVIKYHAGYLHMVYGGIVPYAIGQVPEDHYLSRLMKIFTYGNASAVGLVRTVLYGRNKYFHRLFAFTYEGLEEYQQYIFDNFEYETIKDKIDKLDDDIIINSPYYEDSLSFWEIIYDFVTDYIELNYYQNDKHLEKIIEIINERRQSKLIDNSKNSIIKFISHYIFISTVYHEIIGNQMLKHSHDPRLISVKIRWDSKLENIYPDVQTYYQTALISIATALIRTPRLIEDLSPFFDHHDEKELLKRLNYDLKLLSIEIDKRNKIRDFPFVGANPEYLEISMSI